MSWTPGQHFILLGLALTLALRLASGWAVVPATFVMWVVLVLLVALVDGVFRRRKAKPAAAEDEADGSEAPVVALAPLEGDPRRVDASPGPAAREWRRHVLDTGMFHNERYPRQDICSTEELFLREGDALLLRFHPGRAVDAPARWRCDLYEPGGGRSWHEVGRDAETRIPILRTGVHSLGIGQVDGDADGPGGQIGVWLAVPSPDALSLPLEPVEASTCHYERDASGGLVARIGGEHHQHVHARLPAHRPERLPQGAMLLFASADDAWDMQGIADPSVDWLGQYRHLYRWYLQLSRGDVLVLEQAWRRGLFGATLDFGDGSSSQTDGSLRLYRFVRGPHLHAEGASDGLHAFTCDADGIYCLELELFGPPGWRTRPATDFIDLRLWGAFLQRPQVVRDFELREGSVEGWYRMTMPVPRGLA